MFGKGNSTAKILALVDIASADAAVGITAVGQSMKLLVSERASLSLEERSKDALLSGVLQKLSEAGEKATAAFQKTTFGGRSVDIVYIIAGAPWSHSVSARAKSIFDEETVVTGKMIGALAQKMLSEQQEMDRAELLEATVVRVYLNGYPTANPEGKRARFVEVVGLLSECDTEMRKGAQEQVHRIFPGAAIHWRSSARAATHVAESYADHSGYVIANVSNETTDLIVVRKGVLSEREVVDTGVRSIAQQFAPGTPPEEVLSLMELLESDQCESDACEKLKQAIAKAEPDLARHFGEAMGKLAASRRLPHTLLLSAPPHLAPWLSSFFARIDFTQFTATALPFTVERLDSPLPIEDEGLSLGFALVNRELQEK